MTEKDHCEKCHYLEELHKRTPGTNRDYWLMTELFVFLHGSDVCRETKRRVKMTDQKQLYCPLSLNREETSDKCYGEKCALWKVIHNHKGSDGECGILSAANSLEDMLSIKEKPND